MIAQVKSLEGKPIRRVTPNTAVGMTAWFVGQELFIVRLNDLYRNFPVVDIPEHILGGATTYALLSANGSKKPFKHTMIALALFEIGEYILQPLEGVVDPVLDDRKLSDIMLDLFCDAIGAALMEASQKKK